MLEDAALVDFERRAVAHLERCMPDRCERLGPVAVRASVREAIAKARTYRIESELDVLRLLNVMYVLGFDFETYPRYAWAAELLQDTQVQASSRLEIILDRAKRELFP